MGSSQSIWECLALLSFCLFSWNISMNMLALLSVELFGLCYLYKKIFVSPPSVYLLDFGCFKGSEDLKVTKEMTLSKFRDTGYFDNESLEFQARVMEISGIGDEAYAPRGLLTSPPSFNLHNAREEFETVIFSTLDELFSNCNVSPGEIGGLVVNCSLFCPSPSLADMIINRYKMKEDIVTYHLSGMGCGAGLVSLNLAKKLLENKLKDSYVIAVSIEVISTNIYRGEKKSMLIPNCVFRVGGAAILLTNKTSLKTLAKYRLCHLVGVITASDDRAYKSNYWEEDEYGNAGLNISRDIGFGFKNALTQNIEKLCREVLPLNEKLKHIILNVICPSVGFKRKIPYVPNIASIFEHLCMHCGLKSSLDEIAKRLGLGEKVMKPSIMTLKRFGNTSSSSLWYELGYLEASGRVKKGDRVWQLSYGAGITSHSAIWKALRDIPKASSTNPWNGKCMQVDAATLSDGRSTTDSLLESITE